MAFERLIEFAKARPLTEEVLERECGQAEMSVSELFDAFARELAEGYSKKKYSWSDADAAINHLFPAGVGDSRIPPYAFQVYLAFDDAEYRHPGEPSDIDHESRTRMHLRALHEKG